MLRLGAAIGLCFALGGVAAYSAGTDPAGKDSMHLASTAFAEGARIPEKYTCDGENVSPPLKWNGVPADARSLALIVDDPDAPAGTWVHWVVYDLAPSVSELPEGASHSEPLPGGARQGMNSFRRVGYGGPCPPPGKTHRYFFKLYALDATLELKSNASKKDVEHAMEKHILAHAELMGTYQRK
jgi:Raf kinase inhibitor-like YbhB/YbcL family protein